MTWFEAFFSMMREGYVLFTAVLAEAWALGPSVLVILAELLRIEPSARLEFAWRVTMMIPESLWSRSPKVQRLSVPASGLGVAEIKARFGS